MHAVAHQIVVTRSREMFVTVAWIPAHANILGNEMADSIARSAARLPFVVRCRVSRGDMMRVLRCEFNALVRVLWPYVGTGHCLNGYFDRVSFKSRRHWSVDIRTSWYSINLVTRWRSSHVCSEDHFASMGWYLDPGCGCGAETKTLLHLFNECSLLSEGRPGIFSFSAARFPSISAGQVDYRDLIFNPDNKVLFNCRSAGK